MTSRDVTFDRELLAAQPSLRAFCLRHWRQHGEDIQQETNAKALRASGSFQPGTNMIAWLFTIAQNTARGEGKRASRNAGPPSEDEIGAAGGERDAIVKFDLAEQIAKLKALPAAQRDALVCRTAGLTYAGASLLLGRPAGSIKSQASRARDKMAAAGPEATAQLSRAPCEDFSEMLSELIEANAPRWQAALEAEQASKYDAYFSNSKKEREQHV